MNVNALREELDRWIKRGYGKKEIVCWADPDDRDIDSIQSNTQPGHEPEYLVIMVE